LVYPNPFSYNTIGYTTNAEGAKRMVEAFKPHSIIPADEYMPALYSREVSGPHGGGHPKEAVRKLYGNGTQLVSYATNQFLMGQVQVEDKSKSKVLESDIESE
jgi:hypothetical protein